MFVENYHKNFEEDRRITYGGKNTYIRLDTQEARMGELPALHYGFYVRNEDGSVFERWLSYVSFDGDMMYIAVAAYYPDDLPGRFQSDEALLLFEPHMAKVVEGFKLPMPVLPTNVKSLTAPGKVTIHRVYGGLGNPVGELSRGQSINVTGQSRNRQWWRVPCPSEGQRCWVAADPKLVQPATP